MARLWSKGLGFCVLAICLLHQVVTECEFGEHDLDAILRTSRRQEEEILSLVQEVSRLQQHQRTLTEQPCGTRSEAVSFSARLSTNVTYADQATVVFDDVLANDGGHYDSQKGIFACPLGGMYFFTWTIQVTNGERHMARLMVGVEEVKRGPMTALQLDGSRTGTHGLAAVVSCPAGGNVSLQALVMTVEGGTVGAAFEAGFTSFTGFLISVQDSS